MESSSRMMRCLRKNYKGSDHFGAAADYEDHLQMKHDQENVTFPSTASILVAEAISMEEVTEDDEQTDTDNREGKTYVMEPSGDNQQRLPTTAEAPLRISLESRDAQVSSDTDLIQNPSAVAPGYNPSELDERIILELSSSMVRPSRVIRGTFQITTKRINFIIVDHIADNAAVDGLDSSSEIRDQEKDCSWLMSSLHQMFSRRYLLRRSALELFMVDWSNFFDFGSIEGRKNAYQAIVQARPLHLNNMFLVTQRPEQLLKRTQLMERWARWEISNFEYLIQLNTLAGRSYNDITQPVGALNTDRLKKFKERCSSFDDPLIPKFYYGSHYSSAGTVLYYLVRVEPFTTLSIHLQGGKFDHADRMFSDIAATWNGVLEDMSDVKELVPELFYIPEILTNENSIDFGTTQLGGKLGIYKQRGKEAIMANNVFFYLTYEGTVDIDKITNPQDPLIKALEYVIGDSNSLDGRLEAAQTDVEWTDVESLINELQQIEGIQSVSKGHFFLGFSSNLSENISFLCHLVLKLSAIDLSFPFQVYMASKFENQYKLLARSENKVQGA
ncbi:hypothetical protein HHK36_020127 [Tetracentron sinense]|uniref:Uncharacterized protein n=1 Tax=Tetracentron sinense TaxID=13715 RepID=A0A834YUI9_TETSI|nr:hypothetical protein HHK36_020127 [Tetracentron sinense]